MNTVHVVSMSGGKDSTATALLALELHERESLRFVFADTGNEHSLTYDYLRYLEDALGIAIDWVTADFTADLRRLTGVLETIASGGKVPRFRWTVEEARRALPMIQPTGNPYLDLCILKGRFPSRRAQFCTERLKRDPIVEYQLALIDAGNAVWSWQGVRADESANRARAPSFSVEGGGLFVNRPILRWTVDDVFEAHRAVGIAPNPLYKLGMNRVGCMPCINVSKEELAEIAKRFPDEVARIAEWERIVAATSKHGAGTFFAAPDKNSRGDRQGRGIYAVVEWAKTSRGGTQYDIMKAAPAAACSSAYGLCE